jgi:enoyl-CoA hydratase
MSVLGIEAQDGWALLTLDRPEKKNALSIELRDAISDALDDLAGDGDFKGVAITGAGNDFSAGWDLKEFERAGTEAGFNEKIWASGDRFHHTLLTYPLPLVAAIDGRALAGAFDLAVCCDVRIATTAARFGHPEFQWADVLYSPLEAIVGGAVARDLLLTGRELDAETALRFGLVTELVEPGRLRSALDTTMSRLCAAPRDALMRTKAKAIRRAAVDLLPSLEL